MSDTPDPTHALDLALAQPDPDVRDVPDPVPGYLPSNEIAVIQAARIVRALEQEEKRLDQQYQAFCQMYEHAFAALKARREGFRCMLRDYVERHGPVKSPLVTVTTAKGKRKLVVESGGASALMNFLKASFGGRGVRIKEELDHRALEELVDSDPKAFKPFVREEQGEPSLRILWKE